MYTDNVFGICLIDGLNVLVDNIAFSATIRASIGDSARVIKCKIVDLYKFVQVLYVKSIILTKL
jgi:hypothetical protein